MDPLRPAATLTVAGLGPGSADCLSPEVHEAIRQAEVVAGYTGYVDSLPAALTAGKRLIATPMRDEVGRCREALRCAVDGHPTVLVCSGDPGVYALAGLVLELADHWRLDLPVRILPGIPAVCVAAALLGAPLTHDFACVSLSDLLTPWERIEQRVRAALSADFVLALYNPRSAKRNWQLEGVLKIAVEILGDKGVTGVVHQAYRPGQSVWVGTLGTIDPRDVDMFSIVVIGNSTTRLMGGRMVTPRGYLDRYVPGDFSGCAG